ncbi:MAG: TM2 domain-containing protein [Apilactobacillus sp.]|uniref:TM2 domain-containing protein n=1 Tax=Apilactobacillus TaxID=2767877 RepID=UPI0025E8A732|nr:TM2 domain-containing protein [Apilactobacillus sp.]MCT6822955.1 TM2 domain-containing protein [Apilactobacillus sp.]MCT6857991.1 TM2 domain-containing protein [Apilactobacillus sp.]
MDNIASIEQQVIAARKNISTDEQLALNEYITDNSKSAAVTWLLWIFFGCLGAHRFYLNHKRAGLMLTLWIIGLITSTFFIGFILLAIVWVWWLVDAFSIQQWIKEDRIQKAYDGIPIITGKSVLELTGMQSSSFNVNIDDEIDFSKPR